MNIHSNLSKRLHLLLGVAGAAGCFTPALTVTAEDAKPDEKKDAAAEAAPEYRNWVEVTAGGAFVDGGDAEFQRRHGIPEGAFGGITDFHYEQNVGKKGLFQVDGRGIVDHRDYSIRLELSNPDKGFVRAGFTEYRIWYNGNGGYYPGYAGFQPANPGVASHNAELGVDRREIWFEAGLRLPKWPELTVRYAHETRAGEKDSLSWGEVLPRNAGGPSADGSRNYAPSFWGLDETRDRFAADAKKVFGRTEVALGMRYDSERQDDRRYLRHLPGETGYNEFATQKNGLESDLFNLHASSATKISEKVRLTVGYSFTDLDTDTSGYRVYGTGYDPDLAQRLPVPDTFEHLRGGSRLSQHVANLNLLYTPTKDWVVVPAVRIEKQDIDSVSTYSLPAAPFSSTPYGVTSDRGLLDVAESLEVRYTGLTNWVLYASGNWMQGSGDLDEKWSNLTPPAAAPFINRATDDERQAQKYTAGVNWYPLRRLNLAAQYYHKIRENEFDHTTDSTANTSGSLSRYPAFLRAFQFETDDVNVRATWHALNNLTLITRYDAQWTKIDSRGDGLAEVQTADVTSHILSGSASWVPWTRLYLQGSVNYVYDRTDTPAQLITTAVLNAKNDYWTVSFGGGFAVDEKTDLEARYTYYRADNFVDNSADSVAYGAGVKEHNVTAGLSRRFSPRLRGSLRYAFYRNRDDAAGGWNDYDAHVVYSSVQFRF